MYNYNRDVYQAEFERANAMRAAMERQVPVHLRKNSLQDGLNWLSARALQPVGALFGRGAGVVRHYGGIYWRRSSSRLLGLIYNGYRRVTELVPGRARLA